MLGGLCGPRGHWPEQCVGGDATQQKDCAEHVQRFEHRHLSSIYGAARL